MTDFENTLKSLIDEVAEFYDLNIPENQANTWISFYSQKLMDEARNEMKLKDEIARMEQERKEYERLKLIYGEDEF